MCMQQPLVHIKNLTERNVYVWLCVKTGNFLSLESENYIFFKNKDSNDQAEDSDFGF